METLINMDQDDCKLTMKVISDVSYILSGKWKIPILAALTTFGKMRYMDLLRKMDGIGTKMLSKELQELELNKLISRTVTNGRPVMVEYEMTDHGKTLTPVINGLITWGLEHRAVVIK